MIKKIVKGLWVFFALMVLAGIAGNDPGKDCR